MSQPLERLRTSHSSYRLFLEEFAPILRISFNNRSILEPVVNKYLERLQGKGARHKHLLNSPAPDEPGT